MLSDSQMLFTSLLIDFWLCAGSEHCQCMMVKEVKSQVLSTDSWHFILRCWMLACQVVLLVCRASLRYFWMWRKGLYSKGPWLTLGKRLFWTSWTATLRAFLTFLIVFWRHLRLDFVWDCAFPSTCSIWAWFSDSEPPVAVWTKEQSFFLAA